MPGGAAKSRKHVKQAKKRRMAKKEVDKFFAGLPQVTESKHFGDDTCPSEWFVSEETALNFKFDQAEEEDDLGHYPDGVKRTLTDEQIAMFRHSEMWQLQQKQMQEAENDANNVAGNGGDRPKPNVSTTSKDASTHASKAANRPAPSSKTEPQKFPSSSPSNAPGSAASWKQKRSEHEIPYDQRNKRKWENYIEEIDAIEGSLTHRRLARELDDRKPESVELDY